MSDKNDVRIDVVGSVDGFKGATAQAERELDGLKDKATQAGSGLGTLEQAAAKAGQAASGLANDALGNLSGSLGSVSEETAGMTARLVAAAGPAGVLAVAIGGVAAAYVIGARESKAFADTLILTGNAVGKTTGELNDMALSVANTTKAPRGTVAEALKDVVAFGNVGAQSLEKVVEAAIRLERETGTAVDKTVKQFAELGRDPVKASEKLNEQYNYLTASVYVQIKALQDQGRHVEAATLAQNTFADSISSRTGEIESNLGTIERGWRAIKDAVGGVLSAAANIGRLKGAQGQIDDLKSQLATGSFDFAMTEGDIKEQIAGLELYRDKQQKVGEEKAKQVAQEKAGIEWAKEGDKWLSKREQKEREIAKVKAMGAEAGAKQAEIDKRLAAVDEKYAEKTPRARGGGGAAKVSDYERTLQTLQERVAVANLEINATEKLTAAEREHAKWQADVDSGRKKLTATQYAAAEAEWQEYLALDKKNAAYKQFRDGVERQEQANVKATQAMIERIAKAEEETEVYGLTEAQISAVTQARLTDAIAMAKEGGATEEMLKPMREELELRGKLTEALSARDAKKYDLEDAKKAVSDSGKELDEFAKQAARNMQDAMADFFIDPTKKGMQSIAESFGQTVQKMIAQAAAAQLGKLLFGDMGQSGKAGGWLGSLFGAFSGGGSAAASGYDYGAFDALISGFANGGIMTSAGAVPLNRYAGGGVANSPQFAMFGEGRTPEAFVPLPDGRRIPVAMEGGNGGVNVTQHITVGANADKAEVRRAAATGARSVLGLVAGSQRYS